MEKDEILNDPNLFSEQDLAKYVLDGIVSFDELKNNDGGTPLKKSLREALQQILDDSDQNDWNNATEANTKEAYQEYLDKHKDGKHREEARNAKQRCDEENQEAQNNEQTERKKDDNDELEPDGIEKIKTIITQNGVNNDVILNKIETALRNNSISSQDLLSVIQSDNNSLNSWVVKKLVDDKYLDYTSLKNIGIKTEFIKALKKELGGTTFDKPPRTLNAFSRSETTEVYFWGITSSGKSCALGAILSVAHRGNLATFTSVKCQGSDYMNHLTALFKGVGKDNVIGLPVGTPSDMTYEMGFDLTDDKKVHPISCVDFAGELLECIYNSNNDQPLVGNQPAIFDAFTNLLVANRTNNRKIHFFVLEYGGEKRTIQNLTQDFFLDNVSLYLGELKDAKGNNLFKTSTDAIYILVTKIDKLKVQNGQKRSDLLRKYINENYKGFYGNLQKICKDNQINGGIVEIIPFSLGEVCFQNYCIVEDRYAEQIVQLILERSNSKNSGRFGKIIGGLKK